KCETGTHPTGSWQPKAQHLAELRGQFGVVINAAWAATGGGIRAPALFKIDDRLRGGNGQSAYLRVGVVKSVGYDNIAYDTHNKKRWTIQAPYRSFSVTYTSEGGGVLKVNDEVQASISYSCGDRLGVGASYNYATCTPAWSFTGGNPPIIVHPLPDPE